MTDKITNQHANDYRQLVSQISDAFVQGQRKSALAVNTHLVTTYWTVGKYIVEYEQNGNDRASVWAETCRKSFSRSFISSWKRF
jgi:hypothetical protein